MGNIDNDKDVMVTNVSYTMMSFYFGAYNVYFL
jgi:hypothetical protein